MQRNSDKHFLKTFAESLQNLQSRSRNDDELQSNNSYEIYLWKYRKKLSLSNFFVYLIDIDRIRFCLLQWKTKHWKENKIYHLYSIAGKKM